MGNIQLSNVSANSGLVAVRNIIYYKCASCSISDLVISRLEEDLNCKIEIVLSWPALIVKLGILFEDNPNLIPTVLIDMCVLAGNNLTVSETMSMVSSMYRCMTSPTKPYMGVVLDQPYGNSVFKDLHENDILGLVPNAPGFGYEHISAAISSISSGHVYWPKTVVDVLTKHANPKYSIVGIHVTPRQQEVLNLVCNRGLSNKKIASVLNISESTVKIHISAILKEYGVRNRTQLALAANAQLKA